MMKQILIVFISLISLCASVYAEGLPGDINMSAAYACPDALPTNDVNFCASFRTAATCYCQASGVPAMLCQNMNTLYNRMISIFGTVQRACEYQKYAPTQICIDNWNCYMHGGLDSYGRPCSSNQMSCQ